MKRIVNTSLQPYHSFRLATQATELIFLESPTDCSVVQDSDFLMLGEGSNTIFTTDFMRPIVINRIRSVVIEHSSSSFDITVGAGLNWHAFVESLMQQQIYGLENLALIPGTVGAAPVQNIGAYGREVGELINQVVAWDRSSGQLVKLSKAECEFGYRDSIFKRQPERWMITHVQFSLPIKWRPVVHYGELTSLGDNCTAEQVFNKVISIRQSKLPDPAVIPNAGSFFKNPVVDRHQFTEIKKSFPDVIAYQLSDNKFKLAAGWLIDRLGLKGYSIGAAAVHDKQALVLVNRGNATGENVIQLAQYIRQQVASSFGVKLEAEVRLMDSHGLIDLDVCE
ncbi:UDP-N-acetylmuramate dehydrogenase [Pseudidiomarina taiwanensis]|uniref:UDP-N-acetylenolpyruvoylglucosamine reductase n=1 Tax=Pseudidiomarina taiwanensis TaxID=337250 RepID=A0A432ZM48_9GAMM|nr:UDP-N-acetylmuramate dehydrogenase [Pseudidiomarina taiwanensis]RUO78950.1 UDP-N-acetylenolpyruvoylglucosamine reductase [Pseudidiomarina taiwanensis]